MKDKQKTENWVKHCENGIKVIVNVKDYNPTIEERILIPFIVEHNSKGEHNKMGLLNKEGEIVVEPFYDIILDDCYYNNDLIRVGKLFPYGYECKSNRVSSYVRYKYQVINTKGELITDREHDSISISSDKKFLTIQDRHKGYAVYDIDGKEIVPFGKYDWIDGFDQGLARVKIGKITNGMRDTENKWGIINNKGQEVLPLEYDNIWNFFGKNRFSTKTIKDGVEKDIYFHDLNPDLPRHKTFRILHDTSQSYGCHYGEFEGSYAQDVMGYSDDVINDAFEGDPDAYWNID